MLQSHGGPAPSVAFLFSYPTFELATAVRRGTADEQQRGEYGNRA